MVRSESFSFGFPVEVGVAKREKVCVIMPAYNEADAIGEVLDRLMPLAKEGGWEVIVVDDCSDDGTGKIAEERGARVITHSRNRGYGASLTTGVKAADAEVVVF
ncbi:MAG: glycosyltransferase family 2 protein, partial [Planctomycetota bacterium]